MTKNIKQIWSKNAISRTTIRCALTDMPFVAREIAFFQPYLLYVFGHCDLICWPTKLLRTILESPDHTEKVAKTVGAPRRLRHT